MEAGAWRFEPLDPSVFPVGEGPFRARGVAYLGALKYVESRVPGGRAGLNAALGSDGATVEYLAQIFIAGSDYDVSPLIKLYATSARLEGTPVAPLVTELSRKTSEYSARTLWKSMLTAATPTAMAEKLPATFGRFFAPCTAEPVSVAAGRFVCDLRMLPSPMNGLYVWSTEGFVSGALGVAGASQVRMEFSRPAVDRAHAGIACERVRFTATWA